MNHWSNKSRRHHPSGKMVIVSSTRMFGNIQLCVHKMNYQAEDPIWVVSCQLFSVTVYQHSKLSTVRKWAISELRHTLNRARLTLDVVIRDMDGF